MVHFEEERQSMGKRNTQVVKGQARVVGMINEVHGDAHVGVGGTATRPSAESLPALLTTLRSDVAERQQRGEIETADAEAFAAELDEARRHLPVTDEKSKSGFVVAMKRARGLVADLADLTAKVGEAISAVQGIQ